MTGQEDALLTAKQSIKEIHDILSGLQYNSFIEIFTKYAGIEELNRTAVDELVERIDIYDEHIKITMKGADEFQMLILQLDEGQKIRIA